MSEVINRGMETDQEETGESATVVDVRLKTSRKVYAFEIGDMDVRPGTTVVADSEMGPCLGYVIGHKYEVERGEGLRKVLRIATDEDIKTDQENRPLEEEAKAFCIERVKARNLPMKIVATESTLDRRRLIFYFTADGRIDFRELVRDLAARFRTRIEMRQIGVRDEVKMIGSIGVCGRETCCSSFLKTFEPISIRMAKQQELALSQNKLSGICGRLMCCIAYEYEGREDRASQPCKAGHLRPDEEPLEQVAAVEEPEECVPSEAPSPVIQPSQEVSEGGRTLTEERKEPSGKRHAHRKEQKKQKKGRPFSKRRRFWEKKRH